MEEKILINNIKNNINPEKSLNILYLRHCKIYYKMVNVYTSNLKLDLRSELFAECKYHIYFAAKEFDFKKGVKFSTYLGNKARWLCLNIHNKNKRVSNFIDQEFNFLLKPESDFNIEEKEDFTLSISKKEDLERFFHYVKNSNDDRIKKIFKMRYVQGLKNKVMPWKVISEKMNLSIQGCINIHDNFIEKIKKKEFTKK